MTRVLSLFIAVATLFPGSVSVAQVYTPPCRFKGNAFVREFLECLKEREPRHVEKGKGYTRLGNKYEFGETVVRSFRQAAMYYELACDNANGNGCAYLARLYRKGRGVKKNRKKAAKLLKRAYLFD